MNNNAITIISTVTEEKKVEREITLPYVCKQKTITGTNYYKVISEAEVINVFNESHYASIAKTSMSPFASAIANGQPISEDEFNENMAAVLEKIACKTSLAEAV